MITDFFAHLSAWDIGCVVVGSWTIAAVTVAPFLGRAMRHEDDIRQPAELDWLCSDGYYRTSAEAADWTALTPDAWARWVPEDDDADWLPGWVNEHDEPLYIPQEWSA